MDEPSVRTNRQGKEIATDDQRHMLERGIRSKDDGSEDTKCQKYTPKIKTIKFLVCIRRINNGMKTGSRKKHKQQNAIEGPMNDAQRWKGSETTKKG